MLELLYKRRSIRRFNDIPVEQEKVDQLVKGVLLAPSSRSLDAQRFIVVDNKELLEKLSVSRNHGSSFLKNAPLAIVFIGDSSLSDVWVEDTVIAATFTQLLVESLGLGSCWVQIRNRTHDENTSSDEYLKKLLSIPEELQVECIIGLGYPEEKKPPHTDEKLKYDRVSLNSYGNKLK